MKHNLTERTTEMMTVMSLMLAVPLRMTTLPGTRSDSYLLKGPKDGDDGNESDVGCTSSSDDAYPG